MPNAAESPYSVSAEQLVRNALDDGRVEVLYQPIVAMSPGVVVGYEALSRFAGAEDGETEAVFRAARAMGVEARLEAAALANAFAARPSLPPHCFLSLNVSPGLLDSDEVRDALAAPHDLVGVVIELTEHTAIDSYAALDPRISDYRAAGALIAVDDAGTGYAGLSHLLHLRPDIVKLDRAMITGIEHDRAKRSLVAMLAEFTDRFGCRLVAEGVEGPGELDALSSLSVPLVQGYFLAPPSPPWASIEPTATEWLAQLEVKRSAHARGPAGGLHGLIEVLPIAGSLEEAERRFAGGDGTDWVVLVDDRGRPFSLVDRESVEEPRSRRTLVVSVEASPSSAAKRALARSPQMRYDPLVCIDDLGRYRGVVRFERLVESMADALAGPGASGEQSPALLRGEGAAAWRGAGSGVRPAH